MKDFRKIKRYADTVISVSDTLNLDLHNILNNLIKFRKLVREVPELRYVLLSKRINPEEKIKAIEKIFSDQFGELELEFISLLIKESSISSLDSIIDRINVKIFNDGSIKKIHITTSVVLNENDKNDMIQLIKNKFQINSLSETLFSIDKDIIGGVKIRINNKIIDGSVFNQLKKIRESLLSV